MTLQKRSSIKKSVAKELGSLAIDSILAERGRNYGDFKGHAMITQSLKRSMKLGRSWTALTDDQKEALDMIAHKIGRILNGNPDFIDSWVDIEGYAHLVSGRLKLSQQRKGASE